MAHNKLAPDDEFLSPTEIIRRFKKEFQFVEVSKGKGRESLKNQIAYLQQHMVDGRNPSGTRIDYHIAFLEERLDSAVYVTISDVSQSKAVLSTVLVPDEPVFFGYSSQSHEEACWPLVQRCASVLGYEIVE